MMLFDSTLRRDLSRGFGATLVVILTIVLTMLLIRTLGLAARGNVAPQDVVLLLGFVALGHLPTILALSLFVTIVSTLGRMYRESEMAIWFASGVGLMRFVRPVARLSMPVLIAVAVLSLFVWPWVNEQSIEMRERFEKRSDLSRVSPGQFQTSADGRRTFFIDRDPVDSRTGRNVFILMRDGTSESVTTAREGRIELRGDERILRLERGQRNEDNRKTGEKTLARFESYEVNLSEGADASTEERPMKTRTTAQLLGDASAAAHGELAWRIGLALGAVNLVLLGIGLAYSDPRRAGSWSMVFALLAFVVYYNVINLTQAAVTSERVGLGAALLAAHGSAFVVALLLMAWRDHSAGMPTLRLRRAASARA